MEAPSIQPLPAASPMARLRSLSRPAPAPERCELCGAAIAGVHPHLLEVANRQLHCACDACAILFDSELHPRYRRVPRRIRRLEDFDLSDEAWEGLRIPINLAFFYHSSVVDKVLGMFPSPAGATESLLPDDAWGDLVGRNPVLADMQIDVESLLVNRVSKRRDAYLVPIDECFKLVGLIRTHWRGLSGGTEVWGHIEKLFESLHRRATAVGRK